VYLSIKTIHVLMAIVSVGSMMALPVLAYTRPKMASADWQRATTLISRMISISGIALTLSGFALVSVIGWEIMASPWLIASLTLIALGLVAGKSRRSEWLESQMRRHVPGRLGGILISSVKPALFLAVAALMTIKPV